MQGIQRDVGVLPGQVLGARAAGLDLALAPPGQRLVPLRQFVPQRRGGDIRRAAHRIDVIGLAPGSDPFWSELRVGELKTLLALAISDVDAIIEGCEWIRQFNQLDADRRRVYRCIEALVNLDEHHEDSTGFEPALLDLYGAATLEQAMALLDGELRFFDQPSPGLDLVGCDMHQRLLAAYAKVQALK